MKQNFRALKTLSKKEDCGLFVQRDFKKTSLFLGGKREFLRHFFPQRRERFSTFFSSESVNKREGRKGRRSEKGQFSIQSFCAREREREKRKRKRKKVVQRKRDGRQNDDDEEEENARREAGERVDVSRRGESVADDPFDFNWSQSATTAAWNINATLVKPSQRTFDKLTTQLLWRLNEGSGECLYEIGVDDDGTKARD